MIALVCQIFDERNLRDAAKLKFTCHIERLLSHWSRQKTDRRPAEPSDLDLANLPERVRAERRLRTYCNGVGLRRRNALTAISTAITSATRCTASKCHAT